MISFAVEPWSQIFNEIVPHWIEHHAEVADPEDRGRMPLSPRMDRYNRAFDEGCLHIVVARRDRAMVGYLFAFVEPGLHYGSTLIAAFDLYWIKPDARGHMVGVKLFREAERTLRARGVKKLFAGTKLWLDVSPIFKRTGWKEAERLHTKWIG